MKVLITGGAGFLGSHLAEAWLGRGDEVTALDLASDAKVRHLRGRVGFRVIRESVLNRDILEGLVAWADLVYHLAAVVGVEHYVGDPYQGLTVNINGTQEGLAAGLPRGRALRRGRRSRAGLDAHRPLVLRDLQGRGRAPVLRLRAHGAPGGGAALLQRVRPAAPPQGPAGRGGDPLG